MARKNRNDETERLEEQVRELKSIIRSLEKRLKKVDRSYRREEEVQLEPEPVHKSEKCSKCEEGSMSTIVLSNNKTFKKCSNCGERTKAEKTKETV